MSTKYGMIVIDPQDDGAKLIDVDDYDTPRDRVDALVDLLATDFGQDVSGRPADDTEAFSWAKNLAEVSHALEVYPSKTTTGDERPEGKDEDEDGAVADVPASQLYHLVTIRQDEIKVSSFLSAGARHDHLRRLAAEAGIPDRTTDVASEDDLIDLVLRTYEDQEDLPEFTLVDADADDSDPDAWFGTN